MGLPSRAFCFLQQKRQSYAGMQCGLRADSRELKAILMFKF